eukprot:jgi/Astpho2/8714/e_gw1.00128.54.1_t
MGRRSAKIATRKGSQDARKAKLYGKLGKLIVQAVKAGGPNQETNPLLKEALRQAHQAQLPKDVVDRNMKKASDKSQADFREISYEAYGAGGTGFICECLTDNINRSAFEVRTAVTKGGGKMAEVGSVSFNFERKGIVFLDSSTSEDDALEAAMNAGAEDVQAVRDEEEQLEGHKASMTGISETESNSNALSSAIWLPIVYVGVSHSMASLQCDDAALEVNQMLLERLLAVDDVDTVYTNCSGLH